MELIHTCYRIGEIDRSVAFYEALGFEERGRMPIRDEAINVFMGLPGDGDRLELTYNHGADSYELGPGYNHTALPVAARARPSARPAARAAACPPRGLPLEAPGGPPAAWPGEGAAPGTPPCQGREGGSRV